MRVVLQNNHAVILGRSTALFEMSLPIYPEVCAFRNFLGTCEDESVFEPCIFNKSIVISVALAHVAVQCFVLVQSHQVRVGRRRCLNKSRLGLHTTIPTKPAPRPGIRAHRPLELQPSGSGQCNQHEKFLCFYNGAQVLLFFTRHVSQFDWLPNCGRGVS